MPTTLLFTALDLLRLFKRMRQDNPPLDGVVQRTLQGTLGAYKAQAALQGPLGQALLRLSQAIEDDAQRSLHAPAYHNLAHFRETVVAAGYLCALEFEGDALQDHAVLLAMTAMAGHDFKHDGTANTPEKSLEALAWAASMPYLHGIDDHDARSIERIILGTEPSQLSTHRRAYRPHMGAPSVMARLCMVACEADLTPSLLPGHGTGMAALLAQEWSSSGIEGLVQQAATLNTWTARLAFLRHAQPVSAGAEKLGLEGLHRAQIQAFEALCPTQESQGLSPVKKENAGARYLDTLLDGRHASRCYQKTLASITQHQD